MAEFSGNELVVKALKDEGVDTVFYLTGGKRISSHLSGRAFDVRNNTMSMRKRGF